ncbi:hypothetical protein ACM66B_004521 [Microbotryomycetes sp. NB124-2]
MKVCRSEELVDVRAPADSNLQPTDSDTRNSGSDTLDSVGTGLASQVKIIEGGACWTSTGARVDVDAVRGVRVAPAVWTSFGAVVVSDRPSAATVVDSSRSHDSTVHSTRALPCTPVVGSSATAAAKAPESIDVPSRPASKDAHAAIIDTPETPISVDTPSPASSGPAPRRRRERQRSKPENHTPRPPNAWILYRSAQIQRLKADAIVSKKPQAEISKLIGFMWRDESHATKQYYDELAAIKKAEHQLQYPDYAFKPQRRGGFSALAQRPTAPRRATAPSCVGWRADDSQRSKAAFPSCLLSPDSLEPSLPSPQSQALLVSPPKEPVKSEDVPVNEPLQAATPQDAIDEDVQRLMEVLNDQHLPTGLAVPFEEDIELFPSHLQYTTSSEFGQFWPVSQAALPTAPEPTRQYITPYSAPAAISRFSFDPVGDALMPFEPDVAMASVGSSLGLDCGLPDMNAHSGSTSGSSLPSVVGDDGESCFSAATSLASPLSLDLALLSAEPCSRCDHHPAHSRDNYFTQDFDGGILLQDGAGFSPISPVHLPMSAPATGSGTFTELRLHEYGHSLDGTTTAQNDGSDSPFMFPFAIV